MPPLQPGCPDWRFVSEIRSSRLQNPAKLYAEDTLMETKAPKELAQASLIKLGPVFELELLKYT